jgi:hypothetical protein
MPVKTLHGLEALFGNLAAHEVLAFRQHAMYIHSTMVRAMPSPVRYVLFVHCCLLAGWGQARPAEKQTAPSPASEQANMGSPGSTAQEAYIIENFLQKVRFENDGTETRDTQESIQILSDAGVEHWGMDAVEPVTYT